MLESKFLRIPFLALAVALLGAGAAEGQTLKIGVFDAQRVLTETEEGQRVFGELTAFRDKKRGEIDEKRAKIEELEQQLERQALSLSAVKRNDLEKEIQRRRLDLQSAQESAAREMQLEELTAQSSFQEKLAAVVESFGKEDGFVLILDRSLVAFAAKSVDVTTAIVERFNRMFPTDES